MSAATPTHAAMPSMLAKLESRIASASTAEVDSRRLLQGQREVVIRHGGECYRLRHTRNDKLILTK